jgi:hypothetical protein
MSDADFPAQCWGCHQEFTPDPAARDPFCQACREKIATWHAPERLTGLAQQGFEEAMGMRPPSGQFGDLPEDAGIRAERWTPGSRMPAQIWSGQPGNVQEERVPILPGQIVCRHCTAVLTVASNWWAGPDGATTCPETSIPHLPMPQGLAGGQ